MNYLYGDSTKSHLKQNFLEFLRDSLDFCVHVLLADARIKEGRARIQALTQEADAESGRLEQFISGVQRAVTNGEKGAPDSATAACAARVAGLIADAHRASIDGIRRDLAGAIAEIEAEEAASRDGCVRALGTLLAPHEPPGAVTTTRLAVADSGRYIATLDGESDPALEWTLEVGIPDGHSWSSPMRVDRLMPPPLEIKAPQLAGWITKEVKIKPQRIEKLVVTEVVDDGVDLAFELRNETGETGFDFTVDLDANTTKATRVGPEGDESVGQFDLHADDVPHVIELATKLRASMAGLERRPNVSATFLNEDFRGLENYVEFVERLVAMMTPIVREIAKRSLTPNELVLRRALGDDRREEIFVAKATLREKLAPLPAAARGLFQTLGLEVAEKARNEKAPSDRPPIRSELPPSPSSPPKVGATAPVTTFVPLKSAPPPAMPPPAVALPPPSAPKPRPPAPAPPKKVEPAAKKVEDSPDLEVVEVTEMSSDALLDSIPESSPNVLTKNNEGRPRNEALVAALKKIMMLSKNGRGIEAYGEYATLFSSSAFASYRTDEQRQALKLMVLAKAHPADSAVVTAAHRAALARIQAMLAEANEPGDQELLGVTLLALGDEKGAGAAFQTGLDLERTRNPQSDLVAVLMRRVSQL